MAEPTTRKLWEGCLRDAPTDKPPGRVLLLTDAGGRLRLVVETLTREDALGGLSWEEVPGVTGTFGVGIGKLLRREALLRCTCHLVVSLDGERRLVHEERQLAEALRLERDALRSDLDRANDEREGLLVELDSARQEAKALRVTLASTEEARDHALEERAKAQEDLREAQESVRGLRRETPSERNERVKREQDPH